MTRQNAIPFGILLSFGLAALFWSKAVAQEVSTGRKFAFLVGVKRYDHGSLQDLEYAEEDVEGLNKVLRSQGYSTLVLTTRLGKSDRSRMPTQENIWASLK